MVYRLFALLLLSLSLSLPADARTWHILNDGSGDAPTIQAGIDSCADSDTVLVAIGRYLEALQTPAWYVYLLSEAGPEATIIDASATGTVLLFNGPGWVEGFTLRNGFGDCRGGGIEVRGSNVTIRGNIIEDNDSGGCLVDSGEGGGIYVADLMTITVVENNLIQNNVAYYAGAGIYDHGQATTIRGNILINNGPPPGVNLGGGIYSWTGLIERNLVSGSWAFHEGGGIYSYLGTVRFNTVVNNHGGGIRGFAVNHNIVAFNTGTSIKTEYCSGLLCNAVWGNGIDVDTPCSWSAGHNIHADPWFCDPDHGDYMLAENSPCAVPPQGCQPMGAFGVGCLPVDGRAMSWGTLKARYR